MLWRQELGQGSCCCHVVVGGPESPRTERGFTCLPELLLWCWASGPVSLSGTHVLSVTATQPSDVPVCHPCIGPSILSSVYPRFSTQQRQQADSRGVPCESTIQGALWMCLYVFECMSMFVLVVYVFGGGSAHHI